jgi:hypothetical protein
MEHDHPYKRHVTEPIKQFPAFKQHEYSLARSQEHATVSYAESDESTPHHHVLFTYNKYICQGTPSAPPRFLVKIHTKILTQKRRGVPGITWHRY